MSTLEKALTDSIEVNIPSGKIKIYKVKLSHFPLVSSQWEEIADFIKKNKNKHFLTSCTDQMRSILKVTSNIDIDALDPYEYLEVCNAFFDLNAGFFLQMNSVEKILQNQG